MTAAAWLIVGCGYTGNVVARRLRDEGATVITTRRTSASDSLSLDLAQVASNGLDGKLIPEHAIVVVLAPPCEPIGIGETALLCALRSPRRVVYVSSTGVYASANGAIVDENFAIAPSSASGRARVVVEGAIIDTARRLAIPWTILRPAGIYGPGRGVVARLRAGNYRVIGEGSSYVSRIHVEDLASAIVAAGRTGHGIYNVADDEPTTSAAYADAVATQLGLPPPPRVALADVPAEVAAMFSGNRRIANGKLKRELGVALRYPSWRDAELE